MALGRGLGSLIPQKKADAPKVKSASAEQNKQDENIVDVKNNGVSFVATNKIVPNPRQPRLNFNEEGMQELVNSIKHHGIIQPLVVSPLEDGSYELIAGERRLRASKLANLKEVPVVVRSDVTEHEKLELALIENLQRHDLNPIEEATGYKQLMEDFKFTQDEVGKKMGKSRPVVANMLRLLNLPEKIQRALASGRISSSAGRVLAGIKDAKQQEELFVKMLNGLTVRESEIRASGGEKHIRRAIKNSLYMEMEEKLREKLGTKVDIKKSGKTGKLLVEFYSDEELKKIAKLLNC